MDNRDKNAKDKNKVSKLSDMATKHLEGKKHLFCLQIGGYTH